MVDLSRVGGQLQNVSGIVAGVDTVFNGGPGGSAAQAEQNDFSLARLGDIIGQVGNLLNPPKQQSAPALGDAHTSPTTGTAEPGLPSWVVPVAIGGVGLLLVVLIFVKR